jgi:hypothetical protein
LVSGVSGLEPVCRFAQDASDGIRVLLDAAFKGVGFTKLGWGQGIEIRGNFEIDVLVGCALQCRVLASEEKNQSEQTMIHV